MRLRDDTQRDALVERELGEEGGQQEVPALAQLPLEDRQEHEVALS